MSIEVIAFEHFSASYQKTLSSYLHSCKRHAMFHSFLSYNSKQDSDTTAVDIKRIIELLENVKVIFTGMSTIWDNTDSCTEHYICDTELYLFSILSQASIIIICHGISAPDQDREVLDGLHATDKKWSSTEWPQCKYMEVKGLVHKFQCTYKHRLMI